jgi:4-hydroxy-tetrahydrodipicolinate reductase
MKIGLLGYGKMGQAIEKAAIEKGLTIAWTINSKNSHERTLGLLQQADVVIEFSRPESALDNVLACIDAGVPVVSGTTGWLSDLSVAEARCRECDGAMLWASNFSIGVQVFFEVNRHLARLMANLQDYAPELTEIHHTQKLDAPSGTAVTIAEEAQQLAPRIGTWQLAQEGQIAAMGSWPVHAVREGLVPGTHKMVWKCPQDAIFISHVAHNRTGFVEGAILSARWIKNKRGVFDMRDILGW